MEIDQVQQSSAAAGMHRGRETSIEQGGRLQQGDRAGREVSSIIMCLLVMCPAHVVLMIKRTRWHQYTIVLTLDSRIHWMKATIGLIKLWSNLTIFEFKNIYLKFFGSYVLFVI